MLNKMYLMITIDTENLMQPPDRVMRWPNGAWGEINGMHYGFPKIIDICNRYSVKATFFVNVFECKKLGEDSLKNICQQIKVEGHDIQLHSHPVWMFNKNYMWQFPLEKQITIIRKGGELLYKWTGEYPVAHRAGYYGINRDTLIALKQNGIVIDASMFYGHTNCKLNWSKNKIVERDSMVEIPISVFERENYIAFGSLKYRRGNSIVKFDIDWVDDFDELLAVIKKAKEDNIRVLTLCMHSFSFIKVTKGYRKFLPDMDDIKKFDYFVAFVANDKDIKLITVNDFLEVYLSNKNYFALSLDLIPTVKKEQSLKDKVLHRIRRKFLYEAY